MASGRKFDEETKARVVRLYLERWEEVPGESDTAARKHVGALLGVSADTMRPWIIQHQIETGSRPGSTLVENEEVKKLRRENAELRRANAILKAASAYVGEENLQIEGLRQQGVPPRPGSNETQVLILLCHGKGRKDRITPLNKQTTIALREWVARRPETHPQDPIFTAQGSTRAIWPRHDRSTSSRSLRCCSPTLPEPGQQTVTPHTLRHTTGYEDAGCGH